MNAMASIGDVSVSALAPAVVGAEGAGNGALERLGSSETSGGEQSAEQRAPNSGAYYVVAQNQQVNSTREYGNSAPKIIVYQQCSTNVGSSHSAAVSSFSCKMSIPILEKKIEHEPWKERIHT